MFAMLVKVVCISMGLSSKAKGLKPEAQMADSGRRFLGRGSDPHPPQVRGLRDLSVSSPAGSGEEPR